MRLLIPLCKYCLVNERIGKENCLHRKIIQGNKFLFGTSGIPTKGTLVHHCPLYYKQLKPGTKVELELKEIKLDTLYDSNYYEPGIPEESAEWGSAGWVKGKVVERDRNRDGFILVKLDKPATLILPKYKNGSWFDVEEKEITHKLRRANALKIL